MPGLFLGVVFLHGKAESAEFLLQDNRNLFFMLGLAVYANKLHKLFDQSILLHHGTSLHRFD
ncbi:hypothetical protein D3C73_1373230 [compost metagenome]